MNVAIDISSIIWDKEYFEHDKTSYCQLADEVLGFINVFEQVNAKFVMRQELLDEILLSFPFELTSSVSYFKEFRANVYKFLSKISDIIGYENIINRELVTIPNILHPHFSGIVITEYKYLIREMHTTNNHIVFCTFSSIWESDNNLKTKCSSIEKEYDTIVHPKENIETYINSLKKQFDHNPKHRRASRIVGNNVTISPLSCFDGKDITKPQALLDKAIEYENSFYYYDKDNDTYVRFKRHLNNLYHGFDVSINEIPQKIIEEIQKSIKDEQYN